MDIDGIKRPARADTKRSMDLPVRRQVRLATRPAPEAPGRSSFDLLGAPRLKRPAAKPSGLPAVSGVQSTPKPAPAPSKPEPPLAAKPQPKEVPLAEALALAGQGIAFSTAAPGRPEKAAKKKKRVSRKRVLWSTAGAFLVLILGTGGFLSWRAYTNLHKVFRGTSTVAALSSKPVAPDLLDGEGDGRVNILLLGVGGPGHQGPDLTDTIVVMSIDPVNHTAVMLSVPRDLWVQQPVNYFGKQQKINAAYESGKYHYIGKLDSSNANANAVEAGFNSIDQVVTNVLGIKVNYHMLVNFQAFRQAVDVVDGVTVDVPTELYDPTMAWENHNNPVLAAAGLQQMDGVKALMYARSRETTSDFARSQRQRQILLALKDKALNLGTLSNPGKIDGLMNAFGNNVYSDLSTQGAARLYGIMKKIDDSQIHSVGLTDDGHKLVTTDRVGDASVVRPIAGFDQYADIQAYVRSQLPDGYLLKENAPVTVVAPTLAGAQAAAGQLKTYGYNVTGGLASTAPVTAPVLVDLSKGKDPYTLHYLEEHYEIKAAVTSLPDGVTVPQDSAKFVIILSK